MSGAHFDHLRENVDCEDCHGTAEGDEIAVPGDHVDGEVQLAMPDVITLEDGECTGRCHQEQHGGRDWD